MSQSRNECDPFHYDVHTHVDRSEYAHHDYHDLPTNARDRDDRPIESHYHLDQKDDDPAKWSKRASWHKHRVLKVVFEDADRAVVYGPAYEHSFR